MKVNKDTIYFARENNNVKIPNKKEEDAGYDIYAYLEEDENCIVIDPHRTVMIPTGLRSAFDNKWYIQLEERGSTGTKGISQRCGVIDSGYRGEWMIPVTNTTNNTLVIARESIVDNIKRVFGKEVIIYPYEKAICQAVVIEVPKMKVEEISVDEIMNISSKRGEGKLGSSNK